MASSRKPRFERLDEVEEVDVEHQKDLGLRVIYEDAEILVMTAPNEEELRRIVLNMLKTGSKTLKEIHSKLAGIASEDKIRRCLIKLMDEGIVIPNEDGSYRLLGTEELDGEGVDQESLEPQ